MGHGPQGAERAQPDRLSATLRVQLVISRFQGEKKAGSLPYSFTVTAAVAVDNPNERFDWRYASRQYELTILPR